MKSTRKTTGATPPVDLEHLAAGPSESLPLWPLLSVVRLPEQLDGFAQGFLAPYVDLHAKSAPANVAAFRVLEA